MSQLKMYILIPDDIPVRSAVCSAVHVALTVCLHHGYEPEVRAWAAYGFKKVICKVSRGVFEEAKKTPDHYVATDGDLNGKETAMAFTPRLVWPDAFKHLELYC